MGYYSEIGLCMPKSTHEAFLLAMEEESKNVQVEVKSLLSDADMHEKDDAILYYWSWVKWYDSFPCVGFITRFLEKIDKSDDEDLDYKFVSVGENIADITEEGNYYDNPFALCSVQAVSYDLPTGTIDVKL